MCTIPRCVRTELGAFALFIGACTLLLVYMACCWWVYITPRCICTAAGACVLIPGACALVQMWNAHFFVLTPTKLHFTEETSQLTGNDDDDDTLSMDGDQPVTRQISFLKYYIA